MLQKIGNILAFNNSTRIIPTEQLAGWRLDFEHLDGKLGDVSSALVA